MHPLHLQEAEPGLPSHVMPVITREHQTQLSPPEEPFCSHQSSGLGRVRQRLIGQSREEAAASAARPILLLGQQK